MRRPQYTLRAVLVATLVVAAFFAGIRFEREWRGREDEAAARAASTDFQGVYMTTMQQTARRLGVTSRRERPARQD